MKLGEIEEAYEIMECEWNIGNDQDNDFVEAYLYGDLDNDAGVIISGKGNMMSFDPINGRTME